MIVFPFYSLTLMFMFATIRLNPISGKVVSGTSLLVSADVCHRRACNLVLHLLHSIAVTVVLITLFLLYMFMVNTNLTLDFLE